MYWIPWLNDWAPTRNEIFLLKTEKWWLFSIKTMFYYSSKYIIIYSLLLHSHKCFTSINSMPSCCWLLNSQCISVDYWLNLCFFGLETYTIQLEINNWFTYQVVLLIKLIICRHGSIYPKKKTEDIIASWKFIYNKKLNQLNTYRTS